MANKNLATFGGGCFWCTEAIFQKIKGVTKVTSGYSGGNKENPSYDEVSSGATGHAEAVQIEFDPQVISYEKLVEIFFKLHDPTTKDRQGNDAGSQYRSVIFYYNDEQKQTAERVKQKLEEKQVYQDKIVTEILPFKKFYTAEEYHQNFYERNRGYPYCQAVIDPKIQKLIEEFEKELK
ncbi:MAG: peptide-methionine (S)-S-oxide reductase [Candidatus Doudnabacteria bacterium CG10_big_fil_rev_8_21_14_0_10_42_18]|uniref:Peptide methionine sulfoxide reductase MsrA n=1 Tax=Candidatus Doudnabacteria bacterium CG10_big_fil_rev_8_21_14_0_10_42_18 TaxID=1974552 RepID=A0A2H0VB32_9BACT|nr:MAG: peptide-methionine (S)-S-oxide reductase [Candidatus Doudnabacteria bacterium CG10_big_fil_rev_8_21_14_0_10_42_18]